MSIKKYKPEQIVVVLRQIEVQIANGKTPPQACKEAGIHTQTYYRWRKEYGGLKVVQAKRLKELEKENGRLKLGPVIRAKVLWNALPQHHVRQRLDDLLTAHPSLYPDRQAFSRGFIDQG